MYLYSSDRNTIKVMLTKSDAEKFILNEPSPIIRKSIIYAIFRAALPKSRFSLYKGSVSARLIEYPDGKFILEFAKEKPNKTLRCYVCKNLSEVAQRLNTLKSKNAKISKLYCKGKRYFLISEKDISGKILTNSEHIEGVMEEYADLISKNAAEEISGLL